MSSPYSFSATAAGLDLHPAQPYQVLVILLLDAIEKGIPCPPEYLWRLEALLEQLRSQAGRTMPQTPEDRDFHARLLAELHRNLSTPGYKTVQLCRALGTSSSQLYRHTAQFLDEQHTKWRPMKYLHKMRMEEAKRLLRTTRHTMEVIAEACGFKSGSHLGTAFKKYVGCTPGAWRGLGGK